MTGTKGKGALKLGPAVKYTEKKKNEKRKLKMQKTGHKLNTLEKMA